VTNIDEQARILAEKHYQLEPGVVDIVQLTQEVECEVVRGKKIALLEVNENTVPLGVMPLEFGPVPTAGIHYPTVIIEVTPGEFERIKRNELELPHGWSMGSSIPRPSPTNGK
jgi:hypothetical protein